MTQRNFLSRDTNHTEIYKDIPAPNIYPIPPPNYTILILLSNQTRATSSKSEVTLGTIPQVKIITKQVKWYYAGSFQEIQQGLTSKNLVVNATNLRQKKSYDTNIV